MTAGRHVALVLPGRRYGPEQPLLREPAQALRQVGAQVHVLGHPDVLLSTDVPSDAQWSQAMDLVHDELAARLEGASRVTLLAKSLGTRVLARLAVERLPAAVDAVWLTPLFAEPAVAAGAAAKPWRSLYVWGTADAACDLAALDGVVAATGGTVLTVEGGDHALEVAGDPRASADAVARVTSPVRALASSPWTPAGGTRPSG